MFANAAPSNKIDLGLKDATAQLVGKFIAKHKRNPPVWDNLRLLQSAKLQLQIQDEMKNQRKTMEMKSKKKRDGQKKAQLRAKRAAAVEAERKQEHQQRALEQARKSRDHNAK